MPKAIETLELPTSVDIHRYRNDVRFHNVVQALWHFIRETGYTEAELLAAMRLAVDMEREHQRRFMRDNALAQRAEREGESA